MRQKRKVEFGKPMQYLGKTYIPIKMQMTGAGGTEITLREVRLAEFPGDYSKETEFHHVWEKDGFTTWIYVGPPIVRYLSRTGSIADYKRRGNLQKGDEFGHKRDRHRILETGTGPRGGRLHLIQRISPMPEGYPERYSEDFYKPRWVRITGMGIEHSTPPVQTDGI